MRVARPAEWILPGPAAVHTFAAGPTGQAGAAVEAFGSAACPARAPDGQGAATTPPGPVDRCVDGARR
ncbi:hypothetical protein GCM10025734_44970 [Kitasatospora paranensis]